MADALGSAGSGYLDTLRRKRGKQFMKSLNSLLIGMALAITLACTNTKAPDVTDNIRHALDSAGLSDVHVSQDRDKNVVTLSGNVPTDEDKARAESIAKSEAGSAVVADEIGVRPKGDEGTAKKVDSALDSGIDKNLEAMLVEHKMNRAVRYDVNNGVVTLKGDVPSQGQRSNVEKLAQQVPNVKQVVNELEVKNQRATSTK
jgi:hyperosmotically inducible periplasmic protein